MKKIFAVIFIIFITTVSAFAVPGQKIWPQPKHIDVYIQPGYERSTMAKNAFREWTRLTKNKMVFYFVDDITISQIDVRFVEKVPGNTSPGVIGLTMCQYTRTGKMRHATVWIPTHTKGGAKLSRDEVYTSMLHEIGHAVGIVQHSTNKNNIMYPSIDEKREITKYDLGELYRMYGWKWDY